MGSDASNRRCIAALWTLLETAGGRASSDLEPAAAAAEDAVSVAMGTESYLIVHENDGGIFVDGHLVSLAVDLFAAARGLVERMRAHGVGEILFDRSVGCEDLMRWARGFAAAPVGMPGPLSEERIHVGLRGPAAEPVLRLGRQQAATEAGGSRLRAVYLESQLMAAVDERMVPPGVARCVLHEVVDSLLSLRGGLEPLTLLQRDPGALRRALHVAIVTVHFGRLAGWPQDRSGELGAMALLHDVGSVVDPSHPAAAGMNWLLDRGTDDFWLRSALVAVGWREVDGACETGHDLFATDLVRLAVRHCDAAPAPAMGGLLGLLGEVGAATLAAAAPHS